MKSHNHFVNHYAILGFSQIVSIDEVKTAYRILAKRYHPDLNPTYEAQEKMKAINVAYEILSSQQLKAFYDEQYRQYFSSYQWERNNAHLRKKTTTQQPAKTDNFYRVFAWLIIMVVSRLIFSADKQSYSKSNNNSFAYNSKEMKEADSIFKMEHPTTLVNHQWVKADSIANIAFLQSEKERVK